jgi:hypothetical protein
MDDARPDVALMPRARPPMLPRALLATARPVDLGHWERPRPSSPSPTRLTRSRLLPPRSLADPWSLAARAAIAVR